MLGPTEPRYSCFQILCCRQGLTVATPLPRGPAGEAAPVGWQEIPALPSGHPAPEAAPRSLDPLAG